MEQVVERVEPTQLRLRPYQRETVDAVRAAWAQGQRDVLVVAATGAGKTQMYLQLVDEVLEENPAARALILAHRQELVFQPAERLAQFWPHRVAQVGIVMADRDESHQQIVIATVQTLQNGQRLARILEHGPVDVLVIDECHHATAQGYLDIIATLKSDNPRLRHLGVTATPMRGDGNGLPYTVKVAHHGIKELVKAGYLAPPRWLAIQTAIDVGQIAINYRDGGSDFNQRQLRDVFETPQCFELVVRSHRQYAAERMALAFVSSVEGAYELAQTFNDQGIPAVAADGATPKEERRRILSDFRAGRFRVLVNCALWTEGLDLPEVSCVHQVRPTRSDALYLQMIGRGLRLFPGKEDALILDYAPLDVRNVVMLGDVLGVKEATRVSKEAYVAEADEEGEVIAGFTFDGQFNWLDGSPMEIISRQLDYLNSSPWRWHGGKADWKFLGLGPGEDGMERTLALSPPGETMHLWGVTKPKGGRWQRAYHLASGSFEELSALAETYTARWGNEVLAMKSARWRNDPPSEGQVKFATRLRINCMGKRKGELAAEITSTLALRALKRAGAL